jgi:hypothetical protein
MSNTLSVAGSISLMTAQNQSQASFTFPPLTNNVNAFANDIYTVGTATATVTLPIATVTSFLVYNSSNANTVTVNWTVPSSPPGSGTITLQPLSEILVSNGAISALTLQASAAATPVTVIMGG